MVKIDEGDVLTSGGFIYIQFILASLTLLVSLGTAYLLYYKTEYKKTYFYFSMMLIVFCSVLTSFLYFFQNICDTDTLKENQCPEWMANEMRLLLWETTYVLIFALIVASTFKYTVMKTLNRWKHNLQPAILLIGLLLFLGASTVSVVEYLGPLASSIIGTVVLSFLSYALLLDVIFLIFLLKKLRDTRRICVKIPEHVNKAYRATRNALISFMIALPMMFILFFLNILLNKIGTPSYGNISNLIKNLIHFFFIVYITLDVQSMILIKKLAEVEDCSSSFFGLDSTLVASRH